MQKGRSGSDLRTRFRNFSSHASFFLLYQKPQSQSRYRDKTHNNFCCSSSIRKDESIMKHISELLGLKQQIPVENGMKEGFVPTYIHTYTQVSFYGKNLGRIKKNEVLSWLQTLVGKKERRSVYNLELPDQILCKFRVTRKGDL